MVRVTGSEEGPATASASEATASLAAASLEAAVEVEEALLPQAASRPAAPTAPVTFRKSRREIALLIIVSS
jgi:hypothetical protein